METRNLHIRLIGELTISRNGEVIPLPASKKTRALIGYLVATGEAHRRDRLCDLLWEGPHDPRAELRWSLSKIRPILNNGGTTRLRSDRERVAFVNADVSIDICEVDGLLAQGVDRTATDTLRAAAALLDGEFMDGADLPTCYRFHEWCLAQRERFSAVRQAVLRKLVDQLIGDPQEALVQARALVAADPLSEAGHATVVDLLGKLGKRREAIEHYDYACALLARELGISLSGALERARREIGKLATPAPETPVFAAETEAAARTGMSSPDQYPFVGRVAVRRTVDDLISSQLEGNGGRALLVMGEPGIGKSRLLAYLADRIESEGGLALRGRAFEAETVRPLGAWIDALRSVPVGSIPAGMRSDLALILPEIGIVPEVKIDRSILFDTICRLLQVLAQQRPIAILLDDIQWLDEASASLLHYVARLSDTPSPLVFGCAARTGELLDNKIVLQAVQSLTREQQLFEVELTRLQPDEVAELVHAIDPELDPAGVIDASGGNPLFAIETARSLRNGQDHRARTLDKLFADQFARLSANGQDLLIWAAATGREFDLELLRGLSRIETPDLLAGLAELERRGIFKVDGVDTYDFVHDLIRDAAYHSISQPRRRLVHRHIAQFLYERMRVDDSVSVDIERHAHLYGDHLLAVRGCVAAGERCLRMFANVDANGFAERGLDHLEHLPADKTRIELLIGLLKVKILSAVTPGLRRLPEVLADLKNAAGDAEEIGLHKIAAEAYYLLSLLHEHAGDRRGAGVCTERAAEMARKADSATQAHHLANTARCLLELEVDIPRARSLLAEAEQLVGMEANGLCEIHGARGVLLRWDGAVGDGVRNMTESLALARRAADRRREYLALTWIAMMEFERGRRDAAWERCRELAQAAARIGEDECPFADAIAILANLTERDRRASLSGLDDALMRLRAVDDKSYLAYALNASAMYCLNEGDSGLAARYAGEALAAATAMGRQNEAAISKALRAQIEYRDGRNDKSDDLLRLVDAVGDRERFSSRTREVVHAAAAVAGLAIATKRADGLGMSR